MKNCIRILISFVLLVFLLRNLDSSQTVSLVQSIRWPWLFLTLAVITGGVYLSAWKWKLLASPLGFRSRYRAFVRWYFIGSYFNHFLPTSVGGDAARMALLIRAEGSSPEAVSCVIVERLTGLVALLGIATVGSLLFTLPQQLGYLLPTYGILFVFLGIGIYWLMRAPLIQEPETKTSSSIVYRLKHLVQVYQKPVGIYRNHGNVIGVTLSLSIVFQLMAVTVAYFIGQALELPLLWGTCLFCVPLGTLLTLLPISINGLGVRESAYVALFTATGLTDEQSFLLGFGTSLSVMIVSMMGGTMALIRDRDHPSPNDDDLENC